MKAAQQNTKHDRPTRTHGSHKEKRSKRWNKLEFKRRTMKLSTFRSRNVRMDLDCCCKACKMGGGGSQGVLSKRNCFFLFGCCWVNRGRYYQSFPIWPTSYMYVHESSAAKKLPLTPDMEFTHFISANSITSFALSTDICIVPLCLSGKLQINRKRKMCHLSVFK